MADARRAEFPDSDHPLFTPDEDAQRQVVERIQQAKRGPRRKHPRNYTDEHGTLHLSLCAPMGQHPYVSDAEMGHAWGVEQSRANVLVKHPEKLNPWQVTELCDLLGVTLDWLRGWTAENAYGRFETPGMVAELYERLGAEDKEHVCYLLKRLLGDEQVHEVRRKQRNTQLHDWLERNPDEAEKLRTTTQKAIEPLNATLEAVAGQVRRAVNELNDSLTTAAAIAMQARGDSVEP